MGLQRRRAQPVGDHVHKPRRRGDRQARAGPLDECLRDAGGEGEGPDTPAPGQRGREAVRRRQPPRVRVVLGRRGRPRRAPAGLLRALRGRGCGHGRGRRAVPEEGHGGVHKPLHRRDVQGDVGQVPEDQGAAERLRLHVRRGDLLAAWHPQGLHALPKGKAQKAELLQGQELPPDDVQALAGVPAEAGVPRLRAAQRPVHGHQHPRRDPDGPRLPEGQGARRPGRGTGLALLRHDLLLLAEEGHEGVQGDRRGLLVVVLPPGARGPQDPVRAEARGVRQGRRREPGRGDGQGGPHPGRQGGAGNRQGDREGGQGGRQEGRRGGRQEGSLPGRRQGGREEGRGGRQEEGRGGRHAGAAGGRGGGGGREFQTPPGHAGGGGGPG
mmetsp:Transcript_66116/g.186169  ORF Transcript_66116/g.186169 Transcript_66116/m.186169 type:complete len:383 (+) Transcript_66116:249-1397(+)